MRQPFLFYTCKAITTCNDSQLPAATQYETIQIKPWQLMGKVPYIRELSNYQIVKNKAHCQQFAINWHDSL